MAKIIYASDSARKSDMSIIAKAIPILDAYKADGYRVTLRQLHYQFVARGYMPNTKATYTKICEAMQRGRMAGLIDWSVIEDRTRILRARPSWDDPSDILNSCASCFHVDYWKNQEFRVEIWIEKDALLGVIEETCNHWDCPYFSCRGYPSTSELHEASLRIKRFAEQGQRFRILYCGDHDPSGLDMCEYIPRMLREFKSVVEFKRIALNMEQIERLNPPPNMIKESDSRSKEYCRKYGTKCWELDTLPPQELNRIVESEIMDCIDDMDDFEYHREEELDDRDRLRVVGEHFDEAHEWAVACVDDNDDCDDDYEEDEDEFEDDECFE